MPIKRETRPYTYSAFNNILFQGFTLIELIIVMAILGIIAVIVIIAINPTENQARARDTGRISSVTQIGHSVQDYYTSSSVFPDTANWAQELIDRGSLSTFPSGIKYVAYGITACTSYVQPAIDPTFCYERDIVGDNGILVYAKAESKNYTNRCTAPDDAYFVFSSADGRAGTICSPVDPAPWVPGTQTYVD